MIDEFDENVHFVEIDIEEDPEIAEAAAIMGTPCVQFFKNKEMIRLDYYFLSFRTSLFAPASGLHIAIITELVTCLFCMFGKYILYFGSRSNKVLLSCLLYLGNSMTSWITFNYLVPIQRVLSIQE